MKFWFMVYDFYPSNTAIKLTFITIMIHSNIATLWFWNTVHDVCSRQSTWGRDAMETISALLVHCDGTAFTTDQQCSFDFILVVDLKKVLTRQSSFRWLERPKRPCMWHHSNEVLDREEQELQWHPQYKRQATWYNQTLAERYIHSWLWYLHGKFDQAASSFQWDKYPHDIADTPIPVPSHPC